MQITYNGCSTTIGLFITNMRGMNVALFSGHFEENTNVIIQIVIMIYVIILKTIHNMILTRMTYLVKTLKRTQ